LVCTHSICSHGGRFVAAFSYFPFHSSANDNRQDQNQDILSSSLQKEIPEMDKGFESQVSEILENQRWFGFPIGWRPPVAVLDHPAWTDALSGKALEGGVPIPPLSSSWELVIGHDTDPEGWQYGTVFGHLHNKRAGGRASQRFGDAVRRRRWRRKCDSKADSTHNDLQPPLVSGAATAPDSATPLPAPEKKDAAKRREEQAKRKAIQAFSGMILDLLSRRNLWTLVPWDPSAFYFLYKAHMAVYHELRRQAMSRRLFSGSGPLSCDDSQTFCPPSILHDDMDVNGGTLLQDLLIAATHSRAAYGFAMQAGHISSITSYIRLQTLQPLTFDAVAGVSIEANNEAVAALTGIPIDNILMSHWRSSPYRPCHYVAIDDAARCIVLSVRGSLEIGDLLSDLSAHPMEVYLAGQQGWVHQGILAAATYIHCTTRAALSEASRRRPGWPLLLTGHSLGGGVAALLATLLKEEEGLEGPEGFGGSIRAITVGPAAVMSESLAKACESTTVSLILGSDVVPHLSYASVENLLLEMSQCSPVRRVAEGISKKVGEALEKGGRLFGGNNKGEDQNKATQIPVLDLSNVPPNEYQRMSAKLTSREHTPTANANANGNAKTVPVIQETGGAYHNVSLDGPDLGLLGGAVAQERVRTPKADELGDGGGDGGQVPEHLYPPGRLVWIFPADEDTTDLGGELDEGTQSGGGDSMQRLNAAWASFWEGSELSEKKERVDIAEAEATVAERNTKMNGKSEINGSGVGPGIVVAEAERRAFERLLLMPDMLDDHLPDRYLQALQQL
jgi:hypothetical protein